ncbi:hypothetical protein [Cronobacter phage EspYZU05]|uniref:Uncharacterized protein n=1 Tax=Cronobacter phage EspYZU05 TaxID=2836139 RepID=A0AA47NCR7_9CAUD|nr:hypothetical protein [Cronobacter phage EspYZU05]
MSTGTALVHPDTAKLTPDEQKKGIYHYTPPEVLAFNNGERLTEDDLEIVKKFYGGVIPNLTPHDVPDAIPAAPAPRRVEASPALAAPYGGAKRLVRKRTMQPAGTPLVDITKQLAANLSDDDAWAVLVTLAQRFDLEVE